MTKTAETYYISTYGCQMNLHESEKIAGILENSGYRPAENMVDADIIVFNTCCIRETAEKKIFGHLGSAKKLKLKNPDLIVALCGCMTQQSGKADEVREKYPFVDIVLGTHNLHCLGESINELKKERYSIDVWQTEGEIISGVPVKRNSLPNAWVNIIYGCNNFCSYCIVPYVRGRERSRPMSDIVEEIQGLINDGYKEITLLGQNVNSYGKDRDDGASFAALINEISKIDGKFRLRFMTSHPKDFTDDVIEAIKNSTKACRHIHLPVQAGSQTVLKAMNRKYTRDEYLLLVRKIKAALPQVRITTDVMVGFNGETEEDFLETLDLVKQCRFSNAFCFVFSKRKGTAVFNMPDEIPKEIKTERIKRLIALQNGITREISKEYIGNVYEVLVENRQEKLPGIFCGRTDCGRLVNFAADESCLNRFVNIKITHAKSATLWGEITGGGDS